MFYNFFVLLLPPLLLAELAVTIASDVNCDFETDACGWIDPNRNTWLITNNKTQDPGHDHTCAKEFSPDSRHLNCSWMSTLPSADFVGEQEFTLISPRIIAPSVSCFTFWYHFFGLEKADFKLILNTMKQTFNGKVLWEKQTPQSNGWQRASITLVYSGSFYLIFVGTLRSKYHDTIGLDDIVRTDGACPQTANCDLEYDTCPWGAMSGAIKKTNGTPISSDHTWGSDQGHYLLASKPGNNTISATLSSLTASFVDPFSPFCIKFWFYIALPEATKNQDSSSYIEIYVPEFSESYKKRLSVQDAAGDDMINSWMPFYYTISSYARRHNISAISITAFTAGNTMIAFDDLFAQDSACEPAGDCDFENDFCGWHNTGEIDWIRAQGGNRNNGLRKSPRDDTTTHTAAGWFAMIPAEYIGGNIRYQIPFFESPVIRDASFLCFGFNYFAVGFDEETPILRIQFIDLTRRRLFIDTVLNTTLLPYWKPFRYSLASMRLPKPFSINIILEQSKNLRFLKSDIAIDDISLRSSGCSHHKPQTTTTAPIPINERLWNCNFEGKCTRWRYDTNWLSTSFHKVDSSVNAPRIDHTFKTSTGNYLLWLPSNATANQNVTIISTINSTILSDKRHCITFWYFDSSEILFNLQVVIVSPKYAIIRRSIRPSIEPRSWKLVKVDLPPYYANSYVQLRLTTSSLLRGAIAIDDIQLRPNMCNHVDNYVYTFDSLDSLELAQTQPLKPLLGNIHLNGMTIYPGAPARDHTTGDGSYFLFMNQKTDYNITYREELTLNHLPAMPFPDNFAEPVRPERCIRFAFQAKGNVSFDMFVASVDANRYFNPLFQAFSDHASWTMVKISYRAYYAHKVVFVMSKHFDLKSFVAIDDLSVSDHTCGQTIECDFDDDSCSYSALFADSDFDFGRFVGPPHEPRWPGPAFDHTKRGYGGGYLYMTGYPARKDVSRYAVLQTPIHRTLYPPRANYCISLWTQLSAPDAALLLYLNFYGNRDQKARSSIEIPLGKLLNQTQTQWTRLTGDVDFRMLRQYVEMDLVLNAQTEKADTVIAIDDIQFLPAPCDDLIHFRCANGTHSISMEKTCDFVNDCPDGSDEKNCGICDFESGNCDWSNKGLVYPPMGMWKTVSASAGLGPKIDGNRNANGHYLLLQSYPNNNSSLLISEMLTRDYRSYQSQFKNAYLTCEMTFDYFLSSKSAHFSLAQIEVRVGSDHDSAIIKNYFRQTSDQWQSGRTFIEGFLGSFVVEIAASKFSINETVALDNINFTNCAFPAPLPVSDNCPAGSDILCEHTKLCIDKSDMCDFENNCGDNWDEAYRRCLPHPKSVINCAFEKSLDQCDFFTETTEPRFNWTISMGYDYNLIYYSGPGSDHTTRDKEGQFLLLRSPAKKYFGKKVRLYTPFMITTSSEDCHMRFFYYNNGNQTLEAKNKLAVWAQYADGDSTRSLFTTTQYQASWLKAKVRHRSSSSPFRFVFEAEISSGVNSISLDDVSFYGSCLKSDAKYSPKSDSPAVTIILILLTLCVISGAVYFAFRRYQTGSTLRPKLFWFRKSVDPGIAFVNENHE